jgi:hypothetical protein
VTRYLLRCGARFLLLFSSSGVINGSAPTSAHIPWETNFFPVTPVFLTATTGALEGTVISLDPTGLFLQVAIEIDPPSVAPVPIAPGNQGLFPVAILSTPTFDATTVNPATVGFGPNAAPNASPATVMDVNGDGLPDLVLHFDSKDTGIQCGDIVAVLPFVSVTPN